MSEFTLAFAKLFSGVFVLAAATVMYLECFRQNTWYNKLTVAPLKVVAAGSLLLIVINLILYGVTS